MEIDLTSAEKSGLQLIVWTSDHDQDLRHAARSYTCSFCKRGFSNAQALGGHMNIHRKDRAKLKGFSAENNLLSLDITKHDDDELMPQSQVESSDESYCTNSTPKMPCTVSSSGSIFDHHPDNGDAAKLDVFEDQLQLTLSPVETSSSSRTQKDERNFRFGGRLVRRSVQLISQSTHIGASHERELDLELRLGPEPDHHQEEATKR